MKLSNRVGIRTREVSHILNCGGLDNGSLDDVKLETTVDVLKTKLLDVLTANQEPIPITMNIDVRIGTLKYMLKVKLS